MKGSLRLRLFLMALVLLLCMSTGVETVVADFSHVVRSGETLSSIGRRYGVNAYTIAAINGLANPDYIQIGQVLRISSVGSVAAGGGSYHTVRTGETLYSIGRLYGVNPYSIAAANGLPNPNYIQWGQVLTIPSQSSWSNYWQWPGTTTTTPVPPPPCISAEDTWNYLNRWVCVEFDVVDTHRDSDPKSNAVFLNSQDPYYGHFSTVIWQDWQGCWPQAAEVYFSGRRIRVTGTVQLFVKDNLPDQPQIKVSSCGNIQIVQ